MQKLVSFRLRSLGLFFFLLLTVALEVSPRAFAENSATSPPSATFRQDHDVHPVPVVSRPPLRTPFVDPIFGSTITRITDPSMSEEDASSRPLGLRHEYARYPALNADNTKVAVSVMGGAHRGSFEVREVTTGKLLTRIAPAGDPEISWHPTDANRFFYRFANEVRVFSLTTGQSATLMSFPQYQYISTRDEGRPSDDWRYYAFIGYRDSAFSSADLVVADLVDKRILATLTNTGVPDWISMSPLGTFVVAQWVTGEGTRIYNRETLSALRYAFSDFAHSDFAIDAAGSEVIVYHPTSTKQIAELGSPAGAPLAMSRLADAKKTILLNISWDMTPHFSGLASRVHPGWVLVSTYTGLTTPSQSFSREIFWLKLDGSSTVRRVAHHHSDQAFRPGQSGEAEKDYFAEPQATSSWDGKFVLFSSVWGEPFKQYDLYTVTGQWW